MKRPSYSTMKHLLTTFSKACLIAAASVLFCAPVTKGALIAYWDFDENNFDISQGEGSISNSANLVRNTNYGFYSGTDINAISEPPGESRAFVVAARDTSGWGNGVTWIQFNLDMSDHEGLVISYANYRNNAETFDTINISYSLNGTDFTNATSYQYNSTNGSWSLRTIDLSEFSDLNGEEDVNIRFTFSGASNFGLSRRLGFDNFQFNATAIPEPSSILLTMVGCGALYATAKRRKTKVS